MIDLVGFISRHIGVANTGDNPINRGQCTGLVEVWLDENKRPHIYGNAKDLLTNADVAQYRVFHNSPTNFPPPGAIVCWDQTWGAGDGHTAVVVAASSMYLVVFEQNNPEAHPPIVNTHGYSGVLGWITF
jgi:surface antigen